ncbi:two-component system, chemotaxis family, sensor kinase CheA [Reichenbachiella faecimaris]|uniref:Chemotaxis protein CheA n=1 Tax=Reichenbachiella faecimaris TaxID=692418 RepID=A0A1W2G8B3_REIFA|nr:chemotaxis protein CheA [Reichenbachiella faecimaris]SMD32919.1 two-component system, chemotaxis family, sensor kinase CheA [Reichenbachiella faecimaris]
MKSKEEEYKELFHAEALENFEELNRLFTDLENDHTDFNAINSIFRIVHTLKGNAMGMGFDDVAALTHVMEDVMGSVQQGTMALNKDLFDSLFKANDKLGALIDALKSGERVSYLGIKTKLFVLLEKHTKVAEIKGAQPNDSPAEPKSELTTPVREEQLDEEEDLTQEALLVPTGDTSKNPQAMKSEITFTDVIQIPVKKMDELMTMVGQLIIERDRLITLNSVDGKRTSEFEGLQRITSDLQYGVMNARMVTVGFLFNKFHRIVRDVASIENKNVSLVLQGTECEIDRNILKIMSDAMIHLVRNAVSHGIEKSEARRSKGKPDKGTIILSAHYEKDNVVIEVADDGNGIDASIIRRKIVEKGLASKELAQQLSDQEVIMYIFEPGFSNAEKITEISGRGVGMDVVKKAAESIGGQINVETEVGMGTTIKLNLPSSMALKGALLFELDEQEYAVALSYTEAVISLSKSEIHRITDGLMAQYLDQTIPIIFLKDIVTLENLADCQKEGVLHRSFEELEEETKLDVIVLSYAGRLLGVVVDRLLQQKEIIEKSMVRPLEKTKLLSGTTILGNGKVCLVIDVTTISDLMFKTLAQKTVETENQI